MITPEQNFKIEKTEKTEFKPLPADVYTVELFDITTKKNPTYDTRNNPEETKVYEDIFEFQFTLLDGMDKTESLRGRNLWENFVPTYFYVSKKGKNLLMRIVEAFQGGDITREQEANFEAISLNGLIGKQARIVVEQVQKGDKTYNNISSFLIANTKLPSLTPEEKDKAKVKEKTESNESDNNTYTQEYLDSDINPQDIPFI